MRTLFLFFILTLFLHAQERYCIEVLSTEDKSAITKELMSKVGAMAIPHSLKYVNGKYKLLMGDFKTRQEAEVLLPEVQEKISKSAFVFVLKDKEKSLGLNAHAKMQQAILMAQANMITKTVAEQEALQNLDITPIKPVETTTSKENTVIKDVKAQASDKKSEKLGQKAQESSQELFCKPTKKALREAEITEALSFYKNSSFYTFKN